MEDERRNGNGRRTVDGLNVRLGVVEEGQGRVFGLPIGPEVEDVNGTMQRKTEEGMDYKVDVLYEQERNGGLRVRLTTRDRVWWWRRSFRRRVRSSPRWCLSLPVFSLVLPIYRGVSKPFSSECVPTTRPTFLHPFLPLERLVPESHVTSPAQSDSVIRVDANRFVGPAANVSALQVIG